MKRSARAHRYDSALTAALSRLNLPIVTRDTHLQAGLPLHGHSATHLSILSCHCQEFYCLVVGRLTLEKFAIVGFILYGLTLCDCLVQKGVVLRQLRLFQRLFVQLH